MPLRPSAWKPLLNYVTIFLNYFNDQVTTTRALISAAASDPSLAVICSAVFDQFEPVTLSVLEVGG